LEVGTIQTIWGYLSSAISMQVNLFFHSVTTKIFLALMLAQPSMSNQRHNHFGGQKVKKDFLSKVFSYFERSSPTSLKIANSLQGIKKQIFMLSLWAIAPECLTSE
jgi:hypothetical protein